MLIKQLECKGGLMEIHKTPVQIGSRYNAKQAQFCDTDNGIFWQRYPDYSADMLRLQKALLDPSTKTDYKLILDFVITADTCDKMELHSKDMEDIKHAFHTGGYVKTMTREPNDIFGVVK